MTSATTHAIRSEPVDHPQDGLSLAVADVGWFNTENLFREIDRESVDVLLLKCFDYVNGWRRGLYPWSRACRRRRSGPAAWEQQLILPSGWMKRFPRIGMRPIARSIREWWDLQPRTWRRGLVMSYPHYLHLYNQLRPDVSVYYNIDDYALYWPRVADKVREMERAMVRAADVTICVSRLRAPIICNHSSRKRPRESITFRTAPLRLSCRDNRSRGQLRGPADLERLPRPYLGYIGSLEDRVDWELMNRISITFPDASVVVVGRVRDPVDKPWWNECSKFMSRPNVHALGWRSQDALAGYYQAFDVTLIPYRMDHPFNLACNPTKIMDSMGSGRPIVTTALPECRLHTERLDVAENADEFIDAVRKILAHHSDDGRAGLRHAYALANTCHGIGERILNLIEQNHATIGPIGEPPGPLIENTIV